MQCPDMINAASAWPVPILALVKEALVTDTVVVGCWFGVQAAMFGPMGIEAAAVLCCAWYRCWIYHP